MMMCWLQASPAYCSGLTLSRCRYWVTLKAHGICICGHGGQASPTAGRGMRCMRKRSGRCCMGRQWIYGAAITAAFIAGWLTQGWRLGEQMAEQRAEHIDLLRRTAEANAEVILQRQ